MRNIIFAISTLACASLLAEQITFTSKKSELQSEFFKLRPNYTAAIKAQDSAKFLKATQELKQFSVKIILANAILPSRMLVADSIPATGNYSYMHLIVCRPGTLKDSQYQSGNKTVYQAGDYIVDINDSRDPVFADMVSLNKKLLEFECPSEMTPESIRNVDAFISLISKCIDNHDVTCQKASILKTSSKKKKTSTTNNAQVVAPGSDMHIGR